MDRGPIVDGRLALSGRDPAREQMPAARAIEGVEAIIRQVDETGANLSWLNAEMLGNLTGEQLRGDRAAEDTGI